MKKRGVLLLAIALVIASAVVCGIELTETSNPVRYMHDFGYPQVVSLKYEPYPVEPGEYFKLWVKIENMGDSAKNITCILEPDYPFYLDENKKQLVSYGRVGPSDQLVLEYKNIRVDKDAVEGDNELRIRCSQDPFGSWIEKNFTIYVQTRYPTLNIRSVRTEPEYLEPGSSANLIITLENNADTSMKDITIQLNLSDASFAPYKGVNEKKIRRLNAGKTAEVAFSIAALPAAEGGIHKIPITITYTNELGTLYTTTPMISVEINSKPDIYVTVDSTTLTTKTKTGEIVLKIVNKGLTNVKFLDLELLESDEFKLLTSNKLYIGEVDSDDFETAEFKISTKARKLTLPLKLEYRDANNKKYVEKTNVTLNLASPSELGMRGTGWLPTIIVLAVLLALFLKRRTIINWFRKK